MTTVRLLVSASKSVSRVGSVTPSCGSKSILFLRRLPMTSMKVSCADGLGLGHVTVGSVNTCSSIMTQRSERDRCLKQAIDWCVVGQPMDVETTDVYCGRTVWWLMSSHPFDVMW